MIFDCAVIIPTVLRPALRRAVQSVYEQDWSGTVQLLVGVDVSQGNVGILDDLRSKCPEHMQLTVLDLGYSTSIRNGGLYPSWGGGALRTILSYAANSQFLAYLDDDNWWAPNHLVSLRRAIEGYDWAYSYRWYVDPDTMKPLCVDRWESVGAARGMYASLYKYDGHVDTNCYMLDKRRCHWVLPAWCTSHVHQGKQKGGSEDRQVFKMLSQGFRGNCSSTASVYYVINKDWGRVLKYLLAPVDPNQLSDPKEAHYSRLASKIDRVGISLDMVQT